MPRAGFTYPTHGPYTIMAAMLAYNHGIKPQRICDDFGINRSTFFRWLRRYRDDARKFEALIQRVQREGVPKELGDWL